MSNTLMQNKIASNASADKNAMANSTAAENGIGVRMIKNVPNSTTAKNSPAFLRPAIKRCVLLLLIIATLLSLTACTSRKQTYCEIGFTLPRGFVELSAPDDFDLAFENGDQIIGIRRLSFGAVMEDGMLTTYLPQQLAEIYRERIGVNGASDVSMNGDVPYFVYTLYSTGGTYTYMPTFYRTPYAYFIITFICKNNMDEGTRVKFFEVCDSVYILPEYL